jgi:type IV pilus assembly protein PilC
MTSSKKYLFAYSGYTGQGQRTSGKVRAQNIEWARHKLRRQGLRINSIKRAFHPPFSQRQIIVPADIALFTQQLAMLVKVGIPLSKSFAILAASCNKSIMKMLIEEVSDDIATGDSFSKALRKHPEQFDDLFCNMVEAAELSGELGTVLERLATHKERSERLKKHLKKALTYPCIVVLVAILVTGVLLTKVVPEFARTFTEFGAELPALTLFVLELSELIQGFWLYSLLICTACCGCFYLALKRSKKISLLMDRIVLKLPIVGNLLKNAILARFSTTLATTFNAGLPILEALRSAARTAGNSHYTQSILDLRQDLACGVSLHQAISKQTLFPIALQQMILVGEESGTLGQILDRAGRFYEQDLQLSLDTLTQLTEPLIMLVLGLVVGGLLLAMYLPIFQIGSII